MSDMVKPLDTLSDDELRARIVEAQAILRTRARKTPIAEDPAIGMWADREEYERQRCLGTRNAQTRVA